MKVFLSYSHGDKAIAGQIKMALEAYGLDVFLTHEDIEPSAEWRDVILAELQACVVFFPLLRDSFCTSRWTDQEVGFAVAQTENEAINNGTRTRGFICSSCW